MDLYTLDSNFLRKEIVDNFNSAIWTERYSIAGDVEIVLEPTSSNIAKLFEGTFLSLRGSKEVMILETQSIENGLLTVKGTSLLEYLRNRIVRYSRDHKVKTETLTGHTPGQAMSKVVQDICILGVGALPETARAVIPNLSLGVIDTSGLADTIAIPFGNLYEFIKTLAETHDVGQSLYLDSATEAGYSLKYKTYKGVSRTSDQSVYPVVRFSHAMDTLTKIKEIRSIAGYKTVCYAYSPSSATHISNQSAAAGYANLWDNATPGFHRRVMMIYVEDVDNDMLEAMDPTAAQELLHNFLIQKAKDALANNNYTKMVDGEVVPQNDFIFGTDYNLGDAIELQGHSDTIQKARITEYIRSQDETGERSYPTVSIID